MSHTKWVAVSGLQTNRQIDGLEHLTSYSRDRLDKLLYSTILSFFAKSNVGIGIRNSQKPIITIKVLERMKVMEISPVISVRLQVRRN